MDYLPQFFPSGWLEEYEIEGILFASGVCIGFVELCDGGYSFVAKDKFLRKGVSFADALNLALQNLARHEADFHIARPQGATVVWIEAEDNFASIRMLLPEIKTRLLAELGTGFLFTIPGRDLCLFWNAQAPAEITRKHAEEALQDYEDDEYNLSPKVLVYSDNWPCEEVRLETLTQK